MLNPWLRAVSPRYNWSWPHLRLLQEQLERVTSGEIKRLIVQMPPRHGKSELTTIRYPAYRLERNPALKIIIAAYNQTLANRFSRKARRIAEPRIAIASDRAAVEEWETTSEGTVRAVGVGAGVTGQGGDLIVIDDPVKSREEAESPTYRDRVWDWYTDDLYTRLEPGGAIVLIMTRWHEDDLVGRILASEDAPNWTVISLSAIAEENDPLGRELGAALCPERFDVAALERIKSVQGSYAFNALFQQRPAPAEGGIIKRGWIRYWDELPKLDTLLQSWDMTFKETSSGSFVVGQVWGKHGADCYLIDQFRQRCDFPTAQAAVKNMAAKHPQAVTKLIEDKANGSAIISSLQRTVTGLTPVQVRGSKEARASGVSPLFESGNVWLPHTHWISDYVEELCSFPNAANDDQMDATSQALERLSGSMATGFAVAAGSRDVVSKYRPR